MTTRNHGTSSPGSSAIGFALIGGAGARLLAGPVAAAGPESWSAHERRLGPLLAALDDPATVREQASASGITGRGGGSFPLGRKLDLAARSPGTPVIVVNGSEGEPASRKDQILLSLRPHLVLDGAAAAAFAVGAADVIIYLHSGRPALLERVTNALGERANGGWPEGVGVTVVNGPDTYLGGESSALTAFLEGQRAVPRSSSAPIAACGVAGRPTVISNAETLAHLALASRFGYQWYREAGSLESPGSTLVTLAGDVSRPGLVVEVLRSVPLGVVLAENTGWNRPPRAVLVGGYAGVWVDGARAWGAQLDRQRLTAAGAGLGCGLIGVLGRERCGLAETSRLAAWLSSESAGQCGPCAHGMPALSDAFEAVVDGPVRGADLARIHELAASIVDRGLCHLPDGTAALIHSALETFQDELRSHRRFHRRCTKDHEAAGSPFPLPSRPRP